MLQNKTCGTCAHYLPEPFQREEKSPHTKIISKVQRGICRYKKQHGITLSAIWPACKGFKETN